MIDGFESRESKLNKNLRKCIGQVLDKKSLSNGLHIEIEIYQ